MNPFLAIIIANIIMGMTPTIMKVGLTEIPPFILALLRFGTASLILAPFALRRWQPLSKKNFIYLIFAGLFGIAFHISLFFIALPWTQSINAPIVASSGPVILYIVALAFLKEKFSMRKFAGMFMALIGVLVVVMAPLFLNGTVVHTQETVGNLLMFLATTIGVLHAVFIKKLSQKIDAVQISFVTFVVGSVFFSIFAVPEFSHWSVADMTIKGWSALIFGTFFVSLGAYTLIHYALIKLPAQDVGIFTYIDPVAALLVAWPLLGEKPDIFYFIGSILVFIGIYIAERRIHWHPLHKLKSWV